jgi:hypothetical protein
MPKRDEDKPPQRTIRSDNVYEQINTLANPERNDDEIYEDPITRNQTLSNFNDSGADFQRQGHLLFVMCVSQGELLMETARAVNALMQGDANIRRGIGGLTQEMITTYTVKQTINKKVTGEKKPLLGGRQEG